MHDVPDSATSLPAIRAWSDGFGGHLDAWDYVDAHVTPTQAAALGEMFWPTFVEHGGGVFLERAFDEESFDSWLSEVDGAVWEVEAMINHQHGWDLFMNTDNEPGYYEAVERAAETMRTTWAAALAAAFPDRTFVVELSNEEEDYGPTLTFWTDQPVES